METVAPPNEKSGVKCVRTSKKILFVSNSNEYGGAEKHLLQLVQRFQDPGVSVSILCLDKDFFSERLDPEHHVKIIVRDRVPQSVWDWVRLFRTVRSHVVVFVNSWFWTIPRAAVVGAWLAGVRKRFSIEHLLTPPVSLSPQVLAEVRRRRSLRGTLRRTFGRRDHPWPLCVIASMSNAAQIRRSAYFYSTTICVSDTLRDSLLKDFGFSAKKVKVIRNGVSISEFAPSADHRSEVRAKLGFSPDEFILVCVARLSEQKRIDILLEALARVAREGVACKCIILGDGPLKDQLIAQAESIGLSGRVFFEGFHEDVRPYLQAGSAFILTSDTEGLPLSILEAIACGLPSIVTNVGGNAEIIIDRVHGLIVPRGSIDAIAEGISYLANHPQERAHMAKMARARACEAFDIENTMAEIQRVILG